MSELPPSWTTAGVLELGELLRGVTYSKSDAQESHFKGALAILRANNIQDRGFDFSDLVYVPESLVSHVQRIREGDIVIATSSGSISVVGKAAQATSDIGFGFGAFCGLIRPLKDIESRYYGHFFSTEEYRRAVSAMAAGVNINNLKREHFASLTIPVPPLQEQKRIADKLDAVLARVDACRERLDRVPAILKRFRQSILAAATSGRLTEEWRASNQATVSGRALLNKARNAHLQFHAAQSKRKGSKADIQKTVGEADTIADEDGIRKALQIPDSWAWGRGEELVEPGAEIVYGIVQPGPKLTQGVPYVRGMDIENGKILVDQLLKTSETIAARYARSALKGGDVLLGIIRATKVAIVPDVIEGANITQGTARYRPSSVLRTKYLAIALEAPSTQLWLHEHYRGIDMPGLNLADVRRVPIPLPPLDEQDEIIRRVETLFAFADRLEARHAKAREFVERLTPSLLAKAFRGELVPQDPNDEPASELLKRIQAGRAEKPEKPKRGKAGKGSKRQKVESTMLSRNDVQPNHLTTILTAQGPLTAEALWTASQLDIDDFYDQLKSEEKEGLLKDRRGDSTSETRLLEAA